MSEAWPKCWGKNTEILRNSSASVNLLTLIKGGICSWHYHNTKYNKFYVVSGKFRIRTEFGETDLNPGESFIIGPGLKHLFEALENSFVIEVMYVEYNQDDITREVEGYLKKNNVEKER